MFVAAVVRRRGEVSGFGWERKKSGGMCRVVSYGDMGGVVYDAVRLAGCVGGGRYV